MEYVYKHRKGGEDMIASYTGHYLFNGRSVSENAPNSIGVYYCGKLNENGNLVPLDIGRAKGENVSIRSRLSDHLRDDYWPDVTHFGYVICTTMKEAEEYEMSEIKKYKPKYNVQWK